MHRIFLHVLLIRNMLLQRKVGPRLKGLKVTAYSEYLPSDFNVLNVCLQKMFNTVFLVSAITIIALSPQYDYEVQRLEQIVKSISANDQCHTRRKVGRHRKDVCIVKRNYRDEEIDDRMHVL